MIVRLAPDSTERDRHGAGHGHVQALPARQQVQQRLREDGHQGEMLFVIVLISQIEVYTLLKFS